MKLTDEQRSALDYFAERIGRSRSALVRQCIDTSLVALAFALADSELTGSELRQIVDEAFTNAEKEVMSTCRT